MENDDMENARLTLNHMGTGQAKGNYGTILTTPEAIVREHRKHWNTVHHVNFKEPERLEPVGGLIKTKKHRGSTLEFVCWTLLIASMVYLSIFVFGPFLGKVFFN